MARVTLKKANVNCRSVTGQELQSLVQKEGAIHAHQPTSLSTLLHKIQSSLALNMDRFV